MVLCSFLLSKNLYCFISIDRKWYLLCNQIPFLAVVTIVSPLLHICIVGCAGICNFYNALATGRFCVDAIASVRILYQFVKLCTTIGVLVDSDICTVLTDYNRISLTGEFVVQTVKLRFQIGFVSPTVNLRTVGCYTSPLCSSAAFFSEEAPTSSQKQIDV